MEREKVIPRQLMTDGIWAPDWCAEDDTQARIVCFRKEWTRSSATMGRCSVRISADSRYKLYVNGIFVQEGPQKPLGPTECYVDEAELSSYLKAGKNVICAQVLRYPAGLPGNVCCNASLIRSQSPLFYFHADSDEATPISGGSGWHCRVFREIEIASEAFPAGPSHICAQENVVAQSEMVGWMSPDYTEKDWNKCKTYSLLDAFFAGAPFRMVPRQIPPMRHSNCRFAGVSAVRTGDEEERNEIKAQYEALIRRDGSVTIPANTHQVVELYSDVESCGYLNYAFSGGAGAVIRTTCAECYSYPRPPIISPLGVKMEQPPRKGDRTDSKNGELLGCTSQYCLAGCGTAEAPECYEPFWFRTFRYIRLEIDTAESELVFRHFSYRSVGYPLNVHTRFDIGTHELNQIWDISVRSLELCMHETYVDCPFYEQLQYAMDTRTQILCTYAISADDALARQSMEAFRLAQRPDGLLNSCAPARVVGVIPCFSLFYILMVYDHMLYFGDQALVKNHLPTIDRILSFFDKNLTEEGIVGKIGAELLPGPYWSFIDWSQSWPGGVPTASKQKTGNLTMESLMYLYALKKSAALSEFAGRKGVAEEYHARAEALAVAIRRTCFGQVVDNNNKLHRLVQDGAGVEQYSVHCQAFAILTGLVAGKEGGEMLSYAINNEQITQPSIAFLFYVFRALEMCGMYDQTIALWEPWRRMLKNGLTTCVENETDMRSDCHGWGAIACYEIPTAIFGVRPTAPGYAQVEISPQISMFPKAHGTIITPRGEVHVDWSDKKLQWSVPKRMTVHNVKEDTYEYIASTGCSGETL